MTKQELENNMTKVAGIPVEITVRGKRSFTFSFEVRMKQQQRRYSNTLHPYRLNTTTMKNVI